MKLAIRKIEITDAVALEKLVIEHIDGIEPGLSVIDSRLMLGHSTIDLVAQDATGALVLIALGSRGDENMLLRVVDAYSWCVEYPEAVQRHYPRVAVSEERPPRVVFVMSRVPESFQRKIKQLSFPSVDAVEFHQLEVNGVPAVFFDAVSRIRRGAPAPVAAPIPAPPAVVRHAPVRVAPEPVHVAPEPIRVAPEPVHVAPEPVRVAPEPVRIAVPGPVRVAVETVKTEPVRLAAELSALLGGYGSAPRVEAAVAVAVEDVETFAAPAIAGGSDAATAVLEETAVATDIDVEVAVAVEEAVEPAPVVEEPTDEQKFLFSEAAKAAKIAKELGIQLPEEGALTRQWIDFLNQMAAK